jgi:hypothetical protein
MNDNYSPRERWREIGLRMSQKPGLQRGIQGLALALHDAIERRTPEQLIAYADDITSLLAHFLTQDLATKGSELSEEQIDDLVAAVFSAALDLADTFSTTGRAS